MDRSVLPLQPGATQCHPAQIEGEVTCVCMVGGWGGCVRGGGGCSGGGGNVKWSTEGARCNGYITGLPTELGWTCSESKSDRGSCWGGGGVGSGSVFRSSLLPTGILWHSDKVVDPHPPFKYRPLVYPRDRASVSIPDLPWNSREADYYSGGDWGRRLSRHYLNCKTLSLLPLLPLLVFIFSVWL